VAKAPRDYDPFVTPEEFHSFDAMLRSFSKRSVAVVKEGSRRLHFRRQSTHSARKRRGNELERRRSAEHVR